MIDWIADKLADIQQLILAAGVVLAIVYVLMTWWRTKALVPTLVALLLAGIVLWAVSNLDWFKRKVGEETRGLPAAPAVLDHRPSPDPGVT